MVRNFLSNAKSKLAMLVAAGALSTQVANASPIIYGPNLLNQDGAGFSETSTEGNLMYNVLPANSDPDNFLIDFFYTQPFTSADADSGKLGVEKLHNGLISNPENVSTYGNMATMLSSPEYNPNIRGTSEVDTGWSATPVSDGINLTNNGFSYDRWRPTGQDSGSKDLFYVTLNLNKSLFDGNNNGWSQADVDAGLDYFITKDSLSGLMGQANASAFTFLPENGQGPVVGQYVAIPEPGTLALVGLGGLALGAGLYGRNKKRVETPTVGPTPYDTN